MACRSRMIQYGALPVVVTDGETRVMLITSRRSKRWIIPKGWPEKKLSPQAVAALEAFEEAGLEGEVAERPLTTYQYEKRMKSGKTVPCVVETYLLAVRRELVNWPEKKQRQRRWLTPSEAADLISDAGLVEILRSLDQVEAVARLGI